jgi:hypothetical protein
MLRFTWGAKLHFWVASRGGLTVNAGLGLFPRHRMWNITLIVSQRHIGYLVSVKVSRALLNFPRKGGFVFHLVTKINVTELYMC